MKSQNFTEVDKLRKCAEHICMNVNLVKYHKNDTKKMAKFYSKICKQFGLLIQSAKDSILLIGSTGRLIFWNHATERIFGFSNGDLVEKQVISMVGPRFVDDLKEGFQHVCLTGEPILIGRISEINGVRKNGEKFPIEISLSLCETLEDLFFSAILRDLPRNKRWEEIKKKALEKQQQEALQYLQRDKMASLGIIASGVAHEINNPLAVSMGDLILEFSENNLQHGHFLV